MAQNEELLRQVFEGVDETLCSRIAQATADAALRAMADDTSERSGLCIFLHGDLGAGKTTWARAFLRACGVRDRIRSPSFSVVESYQIPGMALHHLDFYRQSDPGAWQGGGLRDLIAERAISLIEWPEKAEGLPEPAIDVHIDWQHEISSDGPRRLEIRFLRHHGGTDLAGQLPAWRAATASRSDHRS